MFYNDFSPTSWVSVSGLKHFTRTKFHLWLKAAANWIPVILAKHHPLIKPIICFYEMGLWDTHKKWVKCNITLAGAGIGQKYDKSHHLCAHHIFGCYCVVPQLRFEYTDLRFLYPLVPDVFTKKYNEQEQ